jgi:hypothetical protein
MRFIAHLLCGGGVFDLLGEHATEEPEQFLALMGLEFLPARNWQKRYLLARGGVLLDRRRDMLWTLR